jgi:hypothetical protein
MTVVTHHAHQVVVEKFIIMIRSDEELRFSCQLKFCKKKNTHTHTQMKLLVFIVHLINYYQQHHPRR